MVRRAKGAGEDTGAPRGPCSTWIRGSSAAGEDTRAPLKPSQHASCTALPVEPTYGAVRVTLLRRDSPTRSRSEFTLAVFATPYASGCSNWPRSPFSFHVSTAIGFATAYASRRVPITCHDT